MTAGLLRRLAAEAAGTAFLVATVIGTGLMAEQMTGDAGLQLLANALATAAMLGVLIAVLGRISGADFNPAVSLAMCLNRNLPWSEFAPYVVAQVSGGILGALVAHLMFAEPLVQIATQFRGSVELGFSEVVAAFGLVAIILLARKRHTVPLLVASYVGAAYWFTASTSFANPAVTIARMFTDSFSGIRPQDAPLFIAAQLVGATAAWSAVKWIGRNQGTHTGPTG